MAKGKADQKSVTKDRRRTKDKDSDKVADHKAAKEKAARGKASKAGASNGKASKSKASNGKASKSKANKGKARRAGVQAALSDRTVETVAVEPTTVDFWFDPACPWAWLTSRWMLEVEQVRPVKTVFHVMSLSVLNEHKDVSDRYREMLNSSWAAVRVGLGIERDYGQEQLAAFYTAIGTRYHPQGEPQGRETIEKALSDVGLPTELVSLGDTGDWDDDLRASHQRGMDPVGYEVGTPVIHIGDVAWFGPVVTPAPRGEEAGRLFDAVRELATYPGFFELKRTRTMKPIFT